MNNLTCCVLLFIPQVLETEIDVSLYTSTNINVVHISFMSWMCPTVGFVFYE